MTDTVSPITEPQLTPMFATGAQPVAAPNTEPHPAPIFDTGPHPNPLSTGARTAKPAPVPQPAPEPEPATADGPERVAGSQSLPASACAPQSASNVEPAGDQRAAAPEPQVASEPEASAPHPEIPSGSEAAPSVSGALPASATVHGSPAAPEPAAPEPGAAPHSSGVTAQPEFVPEPGFAAVPHPHGGAAAPQAFSELDNDDTDAFRRAVNGHMPPMAVPAQPVVVPGAYQFVKRWKFALIVAGVWVLAAAAGLGCYFWWYTALDKTAPVFGILLYLIACMVGSVLVSLVPERPQITALALALMAAPLASMVAAAVLHGAYYFEWIARPVIG